MSIQFQTTQANCVLLTPRLVPGVVNDPAVLKKAGGDPTQVIQLPDLALATFPGNVQINFLQTQPPGFVMTVAEVSEQAPTARWVGIARAACRAVARSDAPTALGLNFLRVATIEDESDLAHLRNLLNPQLLDRVSAVGIKPETAGMKMIYPWRSWRVTLNVEPDANNPSQINVTSNFHADRPAVTRIPTLLNQYRQAYDSFVDALGAVLAEEANVGA